MCGINYKNHLLIRVEIRKFRKTINFYLNTTYIG
jgi:hypothetical protein